jgi:sulfide dehydrogenase cytochrome subunit
MRHIGKALFIASVGTLALSGPVKAEEASSAVLANTCFSCHGPDGKSAGAMPWIAGKSTEYITKVMIDFKTGAMDSTVMQRIAKGFSDDEIKALAQYFSAK